MQTSSLPVFHCQLSSCEIFKPFTEKLTRRIWGSILQQQQWDLDEEQLKRETYKGGEEQARKLQDAQAEKLTSLQANK